MSRRSAASWASLLPCIAGCLTDLAVGYGELDVDNPATSAVDAGDASERDAASSDAGARDAGELDARAARDASCDVCPDAETRDATIARDASAQRDAATDDAAARDAATHDASAEDAGDQCIPSDCEYVGLVVTFFTCEMGKEPVCTLTDDGVCDLVCPGSGAGSTDFAKGDAATRDAAPRRKPDAGAGERTSAEDAAVTTSAEDAAVTSEPYEAADAAVPAQDGGATVGADSDAEVVANDP